MRLMNSKTHELEEFWSRPVPPYIILSHTWGDGEVSFKDMQEPARAVLKPGYAKIKSTCEEALRLGYSYAWLDTCCIDKRSSSELQEAINTMYRWYANADLCVTYLKDFRTLSERQLAQRSSTKRYRGCPEEQLPRCVWFARGWTLQELIAPKQVLFFDAAWQPVGSKTEFLDILSEITGVDVSILDHAEELSSISVAARMSWAASRRTSRIEDRAYSLLGIFGINMPMLYGEGQNAFRRLQEEIIRTSADQSIFAWQGRSCHRGCLLAQSPDDFANSQSIISWGDMDSFAMTNRGLSITLPMTEETHFGTRETVAILNCRYEGDLSTALALRLRRSPSSRVNRYHVRRDAGGACPHSADLEPSRRLAKIRAEVVQDSPIASIEITRSFEAGASDRKFWLRLPQDMGRVKGVTLLDAYPPRRWSRDLRVMRALPYSRPRGSVLLEFPSGKRSYLVFGCDRAINVHGPDGSRCQVDIPGLLVRDPSIRNSWEALASFEYCPEHVSSRKACPHWVAGRCSNTPTGIRIGEPSAGGEVGWVTIEEQLLMEEYVFVVTVTVDELFEVEANWGRHPLSPAEDATAERTAPHSSLPEDAGDEKIAQFVQDCTTK